MWQLILLSRVIPAFGALAKDFMEGRVDGDELLRDASKFYSDIVNLGWAVSFSRGEWTSGLSDEDLHPLLKALESRFSKGWWNNVIKSQIIIPLGEQSQFPSLFNLAGSITSSSEGTFDDCAAIIDQTKEQRNEYLETMGPKVRLFPQQERRDELKRKRFLKRVHEAAQHLIELYSKSQFELDGRYESLSKHPSHGIRELANKVYDLFEKHWRCSCEKRATREVRLNLLIHRQTASKEILATRSPVGNISARFEVLLPVCPSQHSAAWKATNVEFNDSKTGVPVENNICHTLRESDGLEVSFVSGDGRFWHHQKPRLIDNIEQYPIMYSLRQLLGQGATDPQISKYTPCERLILCHNLANSMLDLYPGNWFHNDWDCNSVYLPRLVNSSIRSALTSPYLRAVIQHGYDKTNGQIHHMQCHPQPSILALGIVFLEIITGAKFPKSQESIPWRRHNEDKRQAEHLLKSLESADRHSYDRKLSTGLRKAVRACLHMEPPPNFPSNNLNKEGPVRHYILSCVVHPLAYELEYGYNIRPEAFETASVRESIDKNLESGDEGGKVRPVPGSPSSEPLSPRTNGAQGSKTKASRTKEAAMAAEWFDWHNDALLRIEELRSTVPDSKRIKIAILDTGIELTSDEKEIYDSDSRIKYKSWIDSDPEWKDGAGHGTHLATLLLRIAPNAIVHVARVFKKQRQCLDSASRIAEAIEHAAKVWQVDIVIMSFGFPCEIDVIHKAIKRATLNGNILFFAAASNDGNNRPGGVVWPAKDMNVICVHSGNGRGKPSSFTPSAQDGMRVMVLGESVKSAWPQKLQEGDEKVMDGTSCATPIAAGIAALILDYARVFLTPEEWVKLRRVDSIRRLFNNMKDPDAYAKDGYWWIKHWEWFDSKQDQSWIEGQIKQAFL